MPPKPKFSKEEIVDAALGIVQRSGMQALTARELGDALGSSPRPIFTVFKNMDELYHAVRAGAMRRYDAYVSSARDYFPSFKAIGILMLRYAKEQPRLFQLLFMNENSGARQFSDVLDSLGETANLCLEFVMSDYGLTAEEAQFLFQYVWTFTYGVSAMCVTGMCDFSEDELINMLGNEFFAIMSFMKSGMRGNVIINMRPVKRDESFDPSQTELVFKKE